MASSVYRSARATPRGTTTSTAPHPRHRYRRASTVRDSGPASGPSGPSTSRPRRPWPTTQSGLPGSRLAAPQPGQLARRAAEHDGGTCAQNLTSIVDWMMRVSLRWIACNRLRRSAAGERWLQPPPATFLSGLHARAFLRRAPYDISGEPGQKRARSARGATLIARGYPSLSLREIGSGSIRHAARQHLLTAPGRAWRLPGHEPVFSAGVRQRRHRLGAGGVHAARL
jgi:hypothetical protein